MSKMGKVFRVCDNNLRDSVGSALRANGYANVNQSRTATALPRKTR
jgi:hypothetical protein